MTFMVSYNPRTKRHNATVVRKDVIPKDANKENVNVAGTDRATTTTTTTTTHTTTSNATASPSTRATRATTASPPGFLLSEEDDALIWRASLAEQVAAATRLALSTTAPIKPRARSVNHVSLIDYDRRAEDGMLTAGGGGGGGGGDDPFHAAADRGFGGFGGFGGENGGGIGGGSSSARRVSRGRSDSGSGWADGGAATWSRGPDEGSSAAGNGAGGSGGSTGFGAAQWQRTVQCGDGETLVVDRRQLQVREGSDGSDRDGRMSQRTGAGGKRLRKVRNGGNRSFALPNQRMIRGAGSGEVERRDREKREMETTDHSPYQTMPLPRLSPHTHSSASLTLRPSSFPHM